MYEEAGAVKRRRRCWPVGRAERGQGRGRGRATNGQATGGFGRGGADSWCWGLARLVSNRCDLSSVSE